MARLRGGALPLHTLRCETGAGCSPPGALLQPGGAAGGQAAATHLIPAPPAAGTMARVRDVKNTPGSSHSLRAESQVSPTGPESRCGHGRVGLRASYPRLSQHPRIPGRALPPLSPPSKHTLCPCPRLPTSSRKNLHEGAGPHPDTLSSSPISGPPTWHIPVPRPRC